MSLRTDLEEEIAKIVAFQWNAQDAKVVPTPESVVLGDGQAKHLASATVLYADIDGSTQMVDTHQWWFCAEIYKAYLACAAKIIRHNEGEITAYDGDRIMAVFVGNFKNTNAVRSAMAINWAVEELLRPAFAPYNANYTLKHVVGVDTSPLHATRIGVRGYNDLVWIGRAANYAAKLTNDSSMPLWITDDVHAMIKDEVRYFHGLEMWHQRPWPGMSCGRYGTTFLYRYVR